MLDIPTPPRLRTPAQQAASRLNGAQSQGPTTPAGRRASSRNATKHGLSGDGKIPPAPHAAELPPEIALFATQFQPQTPYEHDLIRRAALGNLRARHIATTLNALADDLSRNATPPLGRARADQIARLASTLPTNPASAVRQLRRLPRAATTSAMPSKPSPITFTPRATSTNPSPSVS